MRTTDAQDDKSGVHNAQFLIAFSQSAVISTFSLWFVPPRCSKKLCWECLSPLGCTTLSPPHVLACILLQRFPQSGVMTLNKVTLSHASTHFQQITCLYFSLWMKCYCTCSILHYLVWLLYGDVPCALFSRCCCSFPPELSCGVHFFALNINTFWLPMCLKSIHCSVFSLFMRF